MEKINKVETKVEVVEEVLNKELDKSTSSFSNNKEVLQVKQEQNNNYTLVNTNTNNTHLDNLRREAEVLQVSYQMAEQLVKSNMCPFKNVNDVTLIVAAGNSLGFNTITALSNMIVINGKVGLNVALQKAKLLSNGIIFKRILNYEPLYRVLRVRKDAEGKIITITEKSKDGKDIAVIFGLKTIKDKLEENERLLDTQIVDYITTYEFNRIINGKEIRIESSFTRGEAINAGLIGSGKDNWDKYERAMISARAFGVGGREIAQDILWGVYSIGELLNPNSSITYTINENEEEAFQV